MLFKCSHVAFWVHRGGVGGGRGGYLDSSLLQRKDHGVTPLAK
jgi:hypothetical protein